jgi:hypothetical protein
MYLLPAEAEGLLKSVKPPPPRRPDSSRLVRKPTPPKPRKTNTKREKTAKLRRITKRSSSYYEKWLKYRKEMQEWKMRNNILIKTISQFLRNVRPATGATATTAANSSMQQQLNPTKIETPKAETPKRAATKRNILVSLFFRHSCGVTLRSRRVSDRKCICHDDAAALLYSRSYF